jgi:hypothetical protein
VKLYEQAELPSLGSSAKTYPVTLTEPEINTIHACFGFMRSCCAAAGFKNYWDHYGPTLEALSKRLQQFDDGETR